MKPGDINCKRFVRALHSALEGLAGDAHCFGYRNDSSYLEIKEDLQYAIRMVEQGEEFAGRLLYKNIQNISPNTALKIAARAKTEKERHFYISVAEMNEARIQQTDPNFRKRISILDEEEPVLRWSLEGWGAHVCPHCGFGNKGDEYIGEPYRHCPDCGKRLEKPILNLRRCGSGEGGVKLTDGFMDDNKILIKKLNRITEAWKAQFQPPYDEKWTPEHFKTPLDLPLVWKVKNGMLYLDDVWLCPTDRIQQEYLELATEWVEPISMEISLIDSSLAIIITCFSDGYAISGVERWIRQ